MLSTFDVSLQIPILFSSSKFHVSLQTVGLYNYLKQQTAPCEYRLIEEEVNVFILSHLYHHLFFYYLGQELFILYSYSGFL